MTNFWPKYTMIIEMYDNSNRISTENGRFNRGLTAVNHKTTGA